MISTTACESEKRASSSQSKKSNARLVVHGGAGEILRGQYPPERLALYREWLAKALHAGNDSLLAGGNALDAAVAAVVALEDNPLFNASKGAVFNIAGEHELEASVAVSKPPVSSNLPVSRRTAAVTLVKTVKHPILLAKELYLDPISCPHAFLSGPDAERIAKNKGLEIVDPSYFDTQQRWDEHKRGLRQMDPFDENGALHQSSGSFNDAYLSSLPQGTVGAVAIDADGMLACATSTGGKTNKNVGRVGDTPSCGSGFYAASWSTKEPTSSRLWRRILQSFKARPARKECGIAVSGTGDGDYFIRTCTAYDVYARMRYKKQTLQRASQEAIAHLGQQDGKGGLIAVDDRGNFAMPLNSTGMFRGTITPAENTARVAVWPDEALSASAISRSTS